MCLRFFLSFHRSDGFEFRAGECGDAAYLMRTWGLSFDYSVASGNVNMTISGVSLLTFVDIHRFPVPCWSTHVSWTTLLSS